MRLKNTLGAIMGAAVAGTSAFAFAQGQGAVEVEVFAKQYYPDSNRDLSVNGRLFGGGASYFLTDDVSLGISFGEYHDMTSKDRVLPGDRFKDIKGSLTSLDAVYHFGEPGPRRARPYLSASLAHQSLGQAYRSGRDNSTFAMLGAGVKFYFTEHVFLRLGLEGIHNIDQNDSEWMAAAGVGLNFGGQKPQVVQEPVVYEEVVVEETIPEIVRVELDVKFDFDKAVVRPDSYEDIRVLAEFMQQFPQTTTVVKGYTDSIGTEAYNLDLSDRRANAVRNVLVDDYGVAGGRVDAVGYGEADPVASNDTPEGRAINRRVEAEVEAEVDAQVDVGVETQIE